MDGYVGRVLQKVVAPALREAWKEFPRPPRARLLVSPEDYAVATWEWEKGDSLQVGFRWGEVDVLAVPDIGVGQCQVELRFEGDK